MGAPQGLVISEKLTVWHFETCPIWEYRSFSNILTDADDDGAVPTTLPA